MPAIDVASLRIHSEHRVQSCCAKHLALGATYFERNMLVTGSVRYLSRTDQQRPRSDPKAVVSTRCYRLLNHLVGAHQHRSRHSEAQRLGGLEVDDQLEGRGLLDRQIGGLGALEDLSRVSTDQAKGGS